MGFEVQPKAAPEHNIMSAKDQTSIPVLFRQMSHRKKPSKPCLAFLTTTISVVTLTLTLILCWIWPAIALSAGPVTDPQLRVETGMHTTLIRRVLPDLPRNRLITCSDDKTVRVWQMPEMRLISVLRVPIDAGHEGQLYAVAVSPDGRTVVVGGWTGWDWDSKASIYFFRHFKWRIASARGRFRQCR